MFLGKCSLRIYFIIYKMFSHLPGIIEVYSLRINSYANNYGICMQYYIAMARSKGSCTTLKVIVRELFNATGADVQ